MDKQSSSEPETPRSRHGSTGEARFREYVVPEINVLLRVARSITGNAADAEDVVQETLLRAYRSIDRFDGSHPRAWLLTILRNANVNRTRRRRPELLRDPDQSARSLSDADSSPGPENLVVDRAYDERVANALDDLPDRFRAVVELVDLDGLAYEDAAAVLDVPVGTVMSRLHRARKRMRNRLAEQGFPVPRGSA